MTKEIVERTKLARQHLDDYIAKNMLNDRIGCINFLMGYFSDMDFIPIILIEYINYLAGVGTIDF